MEKFLNFQDYPDNELGLGGSSNHAWHCDWRSPGDGSLHALIHVAVDVLHPTEPPGGRVRLPLLEGCCFVVLYCNVTSLAFLGFIGFLNKAAKSFIFCSPPKCSQGCWTLWASEALVAAQHKVLLLPTAMTHEAQCGAQ